MQAPPYEHVVLVDDANRPIGTAEKQAIHNANTPLHRGFSVFLFDPEGNLLLQQRALRKKTWPGAWSNSCCGHPQYGETVVDAMQRRLAYELDIRDADLEVILPDYRYRYERFGVVENELCPVAVGATRVQPRPNADEVNAVRWMTWERFLQEIVKGADYSEWCQEEARLLAESSDFAAFLLELRCGSSSG